MGDVIDLTLGRKIRIKQVTFLQRARYERGPFLSGGTADFFALPRSCLMQLQYPFVDKFCDFSLAWTSFLYVSSACCLLLFKFSFAARNFSRARPMVGEPWLVEYFFYFF